MSNLVITYGKKASFKILKIVLSVEKFMTLRLHRYACRVRASQNMQNLFHGFFDQ